MTICNMDCLNCVYSDCINDDLPTEVERQAQDDLDKMVTYDRAKAKNRLAQWKYSHSQKGAKAQKRYIQSDKGKQAQKRYSQSEKGKAAQKKYAQSDKGKEAAKRHTKKQVESGKNAEYCRRYYWKKKGIVV